MPFENESFDSVVSLFGSYSYAYRPAKAVEEIKRVLKPGGKFFIMAYGKPYRNRKNYILNQYNINSPAKFFDIKELNSLFKEFVNVQIFGMTWLSESISKYLPLSVAKLYHTFETKLLGSIMPNKFYFLNITGQKHA